MANSVKHKKVSSAPNDGNPDLVQSTDWNNEHNISVDFADTNNTGVLPIKNGGTGSASDAGKILRMSTVHSNFALNEHKIYEPFGLTEKSLSDVWTTTRAGNATYNSPTGLRTAAANTARVEYDQVTGQARGLLCEGTKTRLNTISAVVTAPESFTVTAVAHTVSFYGTGTVTLSGAFAGSLVGIGTDNRVTLTFTPTAGTLTYTPSGTVTGLQFEVGADATSLILGEGSGQIRPITQTVRAINELINKSGTTFIIDFQTNMAFNAAINGIFGIGSASVANALTLSYVGSSTTQFVRSRWYAGGAQIELQSAPFSAPVGQFNRALLSFNAAGAFALAVNGVDVGTATSDNPNTAAWLNCWLGALRSPTDNPIARGVCSMARVIPRYFSVSAERAEGSRI